MRDIGLPMVGSYSMVVKYMYMTSATILALKPLLQCFSTPPNLGQAATYWYCLHFWSKGSLLYVAAVGISTVLGLCPVDT